MYKFIFISIIYLLIIFTNCYSQSGWISQQIGTRHYYGITFYDDNSGFIYGYDSKIFKTTNKGANWFEAMSSVYGVINGHAYSDSVIGLIDGSAAYTTTNAGTNWNLASIYNFGTLYLNTIFMVNKNTFYVCGTDFIYPGYNEFPAGPEGIIYKTTNGGLNWFQSLRQGFSYFDIKFIDQDRGAVISGALLRTSNGGQNWYYISDALAEGRMTNPFVDTFYIYDKNGGVIRTTNNGLNFSNLQTNNINRLRGISFVDSKYGFVVGDTGVILRTTNAGNNWTSQNSGTNQQLNGVWFLNKDTGFAVGNSGIILTTYTGGLSSVKKYSEKLPGSFNLYQNYPNPFNPTTEIRFDIIKPGIVKLKIFDIRGREVEILINEKLNAGSYIKSWDASIHSSGVYFYRVEAGDFIETKKMVLIK